MVVLAEHLYRCGLMVWIFCQSNSPLTIHITHIHKHFPILFGLSVLFRFGSCVFTLVNIVIDSKIYLSSHTPSHSDGHGNLSVLSVSQIPPIELRQTHVRKPWETVNVSWWVLADLYQESEAIFLVFVFLSFTEPWRLSGGVIPGNRLRKSMKSSLSMTGSRCGVGSDWLSGLMLRYSSLFTLSLISVSDLVCPVVFCLIFVSFPFHN